MGGGADGHAAEDDVSLRAVDVGRVGCLAEVVVGCHSIVAANFQFSSSSWYPVWTWLTGALFGVVAGARRASHGLAAVRRGVQSVACMGGWATHGAS